MVPIDDTTHWRYHISTKLPVRLEDGTSQVLPNARRAGGLMERAWLPENDYLIDRKAQRDDSYTGISGGAIPQDQAVTESMGEIYDRTHEHLGTTDKAVIRMRRMLIGAARDLARGLEPPVLDATRNYDDFRPSEKILEAGEDWRSLGTAADPVMRQVVPVYA
jgi:hypothetical protein